MTGKHFDIRDQLHLFGSRRSAAHPPAERDGQTAVATLIGADFQQFRFCYPIKPGPVETIIRMVNFTSQSGHQGNRICFARSQGGDSFGEGWKVNFHVQHLGRDEKGVCLPALGQTAQFYCCSGLNTEW